MLIVVIQMLYKTNICVIFVVVGLSLLCWCCFLLCCCVEALYLEISVLKVSKPECMQARVEMESLFDPL